MNVRARFLAVSAVALLGAAAAQAEEYQGVQVPVSVLDRATVRAEAVCTAHAPDQNVSSGSRVNSQVVSTLSNPVDARASAAGPAAPRF